MWNIFKSPKVPQGHPNSAPELHHYRLGRRFDPGAEAEVYLPNYGLPVYIVTRGSGRMAGQFDVYQPPQLWVLPTLTPVGIGGVNAGTFARAGLFDPSQVQFEGENAD